jgi:oligoribonuclease
MITEGGLIWVDCEMTGLDAEKDKLLEIAVTVTDASLTNVIEGPSLIIHQDANSLDKMNDWCKNQFGWRSAEDHDVDNLGGRCLRSEVTEEVAESIILEFLEKHIARKSGVLAGNTVHMDKRFIDKYMPKLSAYMHYRIVDVSTVKELSKRWYPDVSAPEKKAKHRAADDIKESIAELKFYQESIFRK